MADNRDKDAKNTPKEEFSAPVGAIVRQLGALSRSEQLAVARLAAGLVGGFVAFPGPQGPSVPAPRRAPTGEGSSQAVPSGRRAGKQPAKQAPTNPLAGTDVKAAYEKAKKAVSTAKSTHKGEQGWKVPQELLDTLAEAKAKYFRALDEARAKKD